MGSGGSDSVSHSIAQPSLLYYPKRRKEFIPVSNILIELIGNLELTIAYFVLSPVAPH